MNLRTHFIEMVEQYGDEFRNSEIIVRKHSSKKLIYKGRAINIDRDLLENSFILSNEKGKALYLIF